MPIVLGLDSSTQSLSAIVLDTTIGTAVLEEKVHFGEDVPQYDAPNGFIPDGPDRQIHANPMMWLDALDLCFSRIRSNGYDLEQVEAVSGAGQQHGSVYLDESFPDRLATLTPDASLADQLRTAMTRDTSPIWMDNTTHDECREIEGFLGGSLQVCNISGSVAVERFTGPQIRLFSKCCPDAYERTATIHLVSSFLASVLTGRNVAIDFGDGAGMNLMNLSSGEWDTGLLDATAPRLREKLPGLADSATVVGTMAPYFVEKYGFSESCQSVLWTGDNPSSLVGMGAALPGRVVISLGTSDTLSAAMSQPLTDPQGFGHVFGNPWGGFMSLVCFRNGSLAREALCQKLGVGWDAFEEAADTAHLTDEVMLPFFEPEITPRTEQVGLIRSGKETLNAHQQIRLLLEGQFLNMRLHSAWMQLSTSAVYVTGGASANTGICQIIADVFGVPITRLASGSSVAVGAAMRAAHAAKGDSMRALESFFCHTEPDSTLEPDLSMASTYSQKLHDFEQLATSLQV